VLSTTLSRRQKCIYKVSILLASRACGVAFVAQGNRKRKATLYAKK